MAINIDINTRMRSTVSEVVPLIILSSMMLVFFDLEDWSLLNALKQMLRAMAISLAASALALGSLWVGLTAAQTKQSSVWGWGAGATTFLSVLLLGLIVLQFAGGVEQ